MLPIKRVVLFKHGVGYFQRRGEIEGDQQIELSFKAGQMNDVLKSLTTLDYGGGTFAALSYDSEEPLERRLDELNMRIPEKGAISAFLDHLKGARVAIPRSDGPVEGSVIGIEEVKRRQQGETVTDAHLAVLSEGGRLVRIPLLEVNELRFLDENVRLDLQTLLDILFSGLRKDRKRLAIQALGAGKREVSLSYVVEAPVWKTSYRIMLPGAGDDEPLLQGWALVDNTTEDDWQAVELSLVAGLPISFVHDLYTPRYRQRPVVEVQEEAAVAPPVVEAGVMLSEEAELDDYDDEADMMYAPQAPAAPARMKTASFGAMPSEPMAGAARASVQVHTRTQEVGDLFAYEITQPVDIARSRSALVPILQTATDLERVALYNPEIRDKNPMTAFRLKNDTGLTLEGGPVTVFEADSYVGEAMLDTMRRDEERLTPYSVELGVTVKRDSHHKREAFNRVQKHGRYIYKHYRELLVSEYTFTSRLERKLTTYLDHRFSHDVREETPEPVEITDSFWRFRLELEPSKSTDFTVTEVSEQYEAVEVPGIALAEVHQLVKQKLLSDQAKQALEAIAEQAQKISRLDEQIKRKTQAEVKIEKGQSRLRENLKALGGSSEESKLRTRYVSSLAKEEERIEELRREVAALRENRDQEQKQLDAMVEGLEL